MTIFKRTFLSFVSFCSLTSVSLTSHAISGFTYMDQKDCKTHQDPFFVPSRNLPPQFCFKFIGVPVWSESERLGKTLNSMNTKAADYCADMNRIAYRVYSTITTNASGIIPIGTSIVGGYVCLTQNEGAIAEKTYRVDTEPLKPSNSND